jgi:Sec-independent protein translocase protein TatA
MEVLGIGPLELLFIFVIILVVLGPNEMVSSAKKLAAWIRKLRESELFRTSKEIAEMPKKIMKETGLEDELSQIRDLSSRTVDGVVQQALNEEQKQASSRKKTVKTPRKTPKKSTSKPTGNRKHVKSG